jgi:hypothetical protein
VTPTVVPSWNLCRRRGPHSPGPSLPEGERGNKFDDFLFLLFSLLSLWERRAGEVRASKGRKVRALSS